MVLAPLHFAKKCPSLYPKAVGLTSASASVRRSIFSMFVTATSIGYILYAPGPKSLLITSSNAQPPIFTDSSEV